MTEVKTVTGQAIGIGAGNAVAYFAMLGLEIAYDFKPDDPAVFVAMGGTLVGIAALQIGKIGAALKYVFDRFFPEKQNDDAD